MYASAPSERVRVAVVTYDRRLAAACELEQLRVATPGLPSGWWHSG